MSKHSVHAYIRAINHFLSWANREGEPVAVKAQLPRLPKQFVDVLSRGDIQAMEDAAQTERDKLIVRTLADTGIRVGELVALRPSDLQLQGDPGQGITRTVGAAACCACIGAYVATPIVADRPTPTPTDCSLHCAEARWQRSTR